MFDLKRQVATLPTRSVLKLIVEIIAVCRPQQCGRYLASPGGRSGAEACPDPSRRKLVPAAVERVGVGKCHGIEAIELGPSSECDGSHTYFGIGGRVPRSAQAAGKIAVPVLVTLAIEAVD